MFFHSDTIKILLKCSKKNPLRHMVDTPSFVFKIKDPKDHYVWVPNKALATYIFNDKLEYKRLFEKLKNTPRMIIRQNKEIQQNLGFKGLVIHAVVLSRGTKILRRC